MGVELGKVLAKNILAQLGKPDDVKGHDSSVRSFRSLALFLTRSCGWCGYRLRVWFIITRSIGKNDRPNGKKTRG
jgi:hypothetical protein